MTSFIPATTTEALQTIEDLATIIWNEHYTPIIGKAQVDYMLEKFQSVATMNAQVQQGYLYYTIFYKEEAVGYLAVQKQEETLFLSKVYLLKSMRGKKIGKAAFQYIEHKAKTLGCESITLTVNKYNTGSIKAYEAMGFESIEALVIDIGNGYVMDDYKMVKALD